MRTIARVRVGPVVFGTVIFRIFVIAKRGVIASHCLLQCEQNSTEEAHRREMVSRGVLRATKRRRARCRQRGCVILLSVNVNVNVNGQRSKHVMVQVQRV